MTETSPSSPAVPQSSTPPASRSLVRFALLSVATSLLVLGLKFGAYWLTGSVALLSDAIETCVNLAAALVALAVLTYASHAPDADHNFGHDKAEYLSSGVEGALIFVAALGIIASAIPKLIDPQPLQRVEWGLALSVLATAGNGLCAWILLRAARQHRSIALEADAKHLMSDVWTSVGVVVGILLALWTGWLRLDALVALAVAVNVLVSGWDLLSRSFDGLMDRALPEEEVIAITAVLDGLKTRGYDYHQLRTRQAGRRSFVDVHILVPGKLTVQEGHDIVEDVEAEIRKAVPHAEVLTHLEPLEDPRAWNDGPL
jgi:cation diffusion facilitator family transporter